MKTSFRMIAALLLLALCAVGTAPRASFAASDKDKARALFREGNALFNRKSFDAALEKFREANRLFPSYKIDLNIGSTLYALERYEEAAEYYDTFLRKGLESAPPEILKAAREKLDEVKAKVATITLSANVEGVQVALSTRQLEQAPLPRRLYVKPGPCELTVSKPGYQPFRETLTLAAGEARAIEAVLKPEVIAAPKPEVAPPPPPPPPPPPEPAAPGRWKKIAGWVGVGLGGAGIVVGAIFGGMMASAASDYDALQNTQFGQRLPGHEARLAELEDDHAQYKTLTIVGLVTGGVIAVAGGGLLLWYYLGDGKRGAAERAAFVVPYFDEHGGGIAAGARF